jgi:hypothetical protein
MEKETVIYLLYEFKPLQRWISEQPSSQTIEKELSEFLKQFKILNLVFPTRNTQVFVTIESCNRTKLQNKFSKPDYFELTIIQKQLMMVKSS